MRYYPTLKKDGTPSREKKVEVIKVEAVKKGEGVIPATHKKTTR